MVLLSIFYSENDLTQRLIGSSRDYYFEMDSNLVPKFVKLVNEKNTAKNLFTNLKPLFQHHNLYIRSISVDQ